MLPTSMGTGPFGGQVTHFLNPIHAKVSKLSQPTKIEYHSFYLGEPVSTIHYAN